MKVSPSIKAFDPAAPEAASLARPARRPSALAKTLRKWRGFLLAVILPTLLAALYFGGWAAGQYASDARFLVRGQSGSSASMVGGAIGAALGGSGFKPVQEEAMAVRDYLQSASAVKQLREELDVVSIWRRPEADLPARLWEEQPTLEQLLRYYKRMVTAEYDAESSAVHVQVRAFRAEDANRVAEAILKIAEGLVNRLSERQRTDTLGEARREVQVAERRVIAAREALTTFRVAGRALDPARESAASMGTVTQLEGAMSAAQAELGEKLSFMRPDNPQVTNVRNRIAALDAQIRSERLRLTSGDQSAPQQLADYERLIMERDFSDRQLASAVASLETARVDVARQQLYLSRIVQPHTAESAQYPKGMFYVLSIFAVLCVVYGIASLIFAGFREHAA